MKKSLLEGYVGVKYQPLCRDRDPGPDCRKLVGLFRRCGDRLKSHGMTPANGGNLSQRLDDGLVITCSGCNLAEIESDELVRVVGCNLQGQEVTYCGPQNPSSEAMLHWLLYENLPAVGAVVHAHDELATSSENASGLPETAREEPYGTVALARLAADTFNQGGNIIVLKNHGYVAVASDLGGACDIVVEMHKKLLAP